MMTFDNEKQVKAETKTCSLCGRELPPDMFYRRTIGVKQSRCKDCYQARSREKYAAAEDEARALHAGSSCVRAYTFGKLHRKYEAAIIRKK